MTIVTSVDYQPTLRERQEFAVMSMLENAIKGDEPIQTSVLAERILDAVEDLALDDEVNRADEAAKMKPRIRVPAITSSSAGLPIAETLAAFGVKPAA